MPKEPCSTCGGPREDAVGKISAPEGQYEDDFLACCPECGMFVDAEGKCIVHKSNRWHASFWIDRPWTPRGSLTMYDWHSWKEEHDWH